MSTVLDLQKWITKNALDLTEEGRIHRFDLVHTVEQGVAERCHSIDVADGIADVEHVAGEFMQIAERDASTRESGSFQRYVIAAYRNKTIEPECTFPFVLAGRRSGVGFSGDSDPANEKGIIAATLRQSNEGHRIIMQMANATAGHVATDNEKLRARLDAMEEKWLERRLFMEDLLDRKADRQLAEAQNIQRAKRVDEFVGMLMALSPLIITKLLGRDAGKFVETATLRDMSIGKLLGNLSEKEIMGVIHSLDGQNRLVFLEAYKSYREEHASKDREKPTVLQDKPPEPEEEPRH